eukprot:jgi/Mesvir1/732/Mv17338-RA.1
MEASTCFASCAAALSTRGSIEIASLSGIRQCQRVSCRGNGVGLASAPRFSNWAKFRPEKRLSRKNISISASASLNDGRVDPVKWAERAPYGDPTARRSDLDGRVALKDIKEGQVMAGEIAAVNLYLGAFVDVGAEYDGLVRVQESDWWALRNELRINQRVIVQVVGVYDPTRYRCPLVLKMLSPDISADLLEDYSNDMPIIIRKGESVNAVAKEVGRVEKASAPRNYDSMGSLADDGDLDMEDKDTLGGAKQAEDSAALELKAYEAQMMKRVYDAAEMEMLEEGDGDVTSSTVHAGADSEGALMARPKTRARVVADDDDLEDDDVEELDDEELDEDYYEEDEDVDEEDEDEDVDDVDESLDDEI